MSAPSPRKPRPFWRPDVRADVDDELAFHIDMRAAEYVAAGVPPDDARRRALARFGAPDPVRAECVAIGDRRQRAMHRAEFRLTLRHDLAFALRTLRRQRLPALVAVVCLALGIGATTTVFSVANTLLVRPLPFPNGDRLVRFVTLRDGQPMPSGVSSFEDVADWRARQRAVAHIGAYERRDFTLLRDGGGALAERVRGARVSAELFPALGVSPERGRLFGPADDVPGAARVAVVSRGFADRMMGGAERAVGAMVRLGGEPVTVVGVLPERWRYPETAEVWVPLAIAANPESRGNRYLQTVAALRPGVPLDQARRDVAALGEALARENPIHNTETRVELEPLRERYVGQARPAFLAMVVAAALVFLTACANVASLQLARAASRAGEIAVRAALGAARRRLVTQLLTESMLLALVGGALGSGLAVAGSGAVARAVARDLPPWMTFGVDWRVLAFTLGVSALTGLLFGLAPALRLARADTPRALRAAGRGAAGLDLTRGRFYRGLVAAEVGLSVVLLVGAGLAVESFARLRRVDPGFDPQGVVAFRLAMQGPRYESDTARAALMRAVVERAAAVPGARAVGATTHLPIRDCCSRFGFAIEGRPEDPGRRPMATGALVTPGYFRALGIPIVRGRAFTDADGAGAPRVTVVSETFARQYWPGEDPLGKRFQLGSDFWTVVGVARDVKQAALADAPEPQFYRPHAQDAWGDMTVAVRAATPAAAAALVPALRRAVQATDPTLPPFGFAPMTETIGRALAAERLYGALFAAYAVVALALATAGVYGVAAYYVSRRTHEIGVRMALGAGRAQVHRAVLGQGAAVAALGLALGLVGAAAGARVLARVLYGVSAGAPGMYVGAAGVIALTVCLATFGPARRASRLAPSSALRAE